MSKYEIALILGVGLSLVGVALTIALVRVRLRDLKARRYSARLETIPELAAPVLVFGGLTIVQLANLAMHAADGTWPHDIALSITATASATFVFGMLVGRLFTRWQLHRLHGVIDTDTGAIRPHD